MSYIKKFWAFIVAWFVKLDLLPSYVEGSIATAGVLEDGNIPAFQSGTATMAAGTAAVPNVYLTKKSWIGLTRLTFPASAADAGELRAVQPPNAAAVDGYGNTLNIQSTDAQDAGLLSWCIITDLSDMETCLPPAA